MGTLVAAVLGTDCKVTTVLVGLLEILSSPLFGMGLFWALWWSLALVSHCRNQPAPASPHVSRVSKPW